MRSVLQRIARRCPTHDQPSRRRIRELEQDLGYEPSDTEPLTFTEAYSRPEMIDCGHRWCRTRA